MGNKETITGKQAKNKQINEELHARDKRYE